MSLSMGSFKTANPDAAAISAPRDTSLEQTLPITHPANGTVIAHNMGQSSPTPMLPELGIEKLIKEHTFKPGDPLPEFKPATSANALDLTIPKAWGAQQDGSIDIKAVYTSYSNIRINGQRPNMQEYAEILDRLAGPVDQARKGQGDNFSEPQALRHDLHVVTGTSTGLGGSSLGIQSNPHSILTGGEGSQAAVFGNFVTGDVVDLSKRNKLYVGSVVKGDLVAALAARYQPESSGQLHSELLEVKNRQLTKAFSDTAGSIDAFERGESDPFKGVRESLRGKGFLNTATEIEAMNKVLTAPTAAEKREALSRFYDLQLNNYKIHPENEFRQMTLARGIKSSVDDAFADAGVTIDEEGELEFPDGKTEADIKFDPASVIKYYDKYYSERDPNAVKNADAYLRDILKLQQDLKNPGWYSLIAEPKNGQAPYPGYVPAVERAPINAPNPTEPAKQPSPRVEPTGDKGVGVTFGPVNNPKMKPLPPLEGFDLGAPKPEGVPKSDPKPDLGSDKVYPGVPTQGLNINNTAHTDRPTLEPLVKTTFPNGSVGDLPYRKPIADTQPAPAPTSPALSYNNLENALKQRRADALVMNQGYVDNGLVVKNKYYIPYTSGSTTVVDLAVLMALNSDKIDKYQRNHTGHTVYTKGDKGELVPAFQIALTPSQAANLDTMFVDQIRQRSADERARDKASSEAFANKLNADQEVVKASVDRAIAEANQVLEAGKGQFTTPPYQPRRAVNPPSAPFVSTLPGTAKEALSQLPDTSWKPWANNSPNQAPQPSNNNPPLSYRSPSQQSTQPAQRELSPLDKAQQLFAPARQVLDALVVLSADVALGIRVSIQESFEAIEAAKLNKDDLKLIQETARLAAILLAAAGLIAVATGGRLAIKV